MKGLWRRILVGGLCASLSLLYAFPIQAAQSNGAALQALGQLPFSMVIGRTHVNDIVRRGNCVDGQVIPENKNIFDFSVKDKKPCRRFDMAGRFEVFLSESGYVNKVIFLNHRGHVFPRGWRSAGLSLGVEGKRPGTSYDAFKRMLSDAKNIRIAAEGQDDITLTFEIGRNIYEAQFWKKDSSVEPDRDADTWVWRSGLFRLEVVEGY